VNFQKLLKSHGSLRILIFSAVTLIHILILFYLHLNLKTEAQEVIEKAKVIKLVDVQEYIPPPPPVEKPPVKKIQISDQPSASEEIITVEEEIETTEKAPVVSDYEEPVYLPQHKISKIPGIPNDQILERIIYPPMALRQNIEAVVYLELFIDQKGVIRHVSVLKDPGHGFAESAIKALEGLHCSPAEANGVPVAVRYRYPIRFVLN